VAVCSGVASTRPDSQKSGGFDEVVADIVPAGNDRQLPRVKRAVIQRDLLARLGRRNSDQTPARCQHPLRNIDCRRTAHGVVDDIDTTGVLADPLRQRGIADGGEVGDAARERRGRPLAIAVGTENAHRCSPPRARRQSDGTASDHQGGVPRADCASAHDMHAHGERFDQCTVAVQHRLGNRYYTPGVSCSSVHAIGVASRTVEPSTGAYSASTDSLVHGLESRVNPLGAAGLEQHGGGVFAVSSGDEAA
jgi:hypothetical protein